MNSLLNLSDKLCSCKNDNKTNNNIYYNTSETNCNLICLDNKVLKCLNSNYTYSNTIITAIFNCLIFNSNNKKKDSRDLNNLFFSPILKRIFKIENNALSHNNNNVFSAIIVEKAIKSETKLFCVCMSTGNRSINNKNLYNNINNTYIIKDSHAEVLCMKLFKFYIIKCVKYLLSVKNKINNSYSNEKLLHKINKILTTNNNTPNFENQLYYDIFHIENNCILLQDNVKFHLYISEYPCGDCSIFRLPNKTIKERNYIKDLNNQTGSKPIKLLINKFSNQFSGNNLFDNSKGLIRSKAMRSDTIKENISLSVSCSDKLMLKHYLGFEGNLLSNIINKIDFCSIIINDNNLSKMTACEYYNIIKTVYSSLIITNKEDYYNYYFNYDNNSLFNYYSSIVENELSKRLSNLVLPNIVIVDNILPSLVENFALKSCMTNYFNFNNNDGCSKYWLYEDKSISIIETNTGKKFGISKNADLYKNRISICNYNYYLEVFQLFCNIENMNYYNYHASNNIVKLDIPLITNLNQVLLEYINFKCKSDDNLEKTINYVMSDNVNIIKNHQIVKDIELIIVTFINYIKHKYNNNYNNSKNIINKILYIDMFKNLKTN